MKLKASKKLIQSDDGDGDQDLDFTPIMFLPNRVVIYASVANCTVQNFI